VPSPDPRYARHVSVEGFGARGQARVAATAPRLGADAAADPAAAVAATFLAAGGAGGLVTAGGAPVALPASPPWWPAVDGDASALALYRGAVAATRWMLAVAAAEPIPPTLLAAVHAHARQAHPRECCGYLVGPRDAPVDEIVRCTNAATEPDRYEIAGTELIALARSLGGPRPARVVYHSHPNGRAYFSARDRDAAATAAGPVYPVAHLVIGVDASGVRDTAVFAWDGSGYAEVARDPAC
jgi:adenylyltransferase/sulfurtransferase